MGKRTTLMDDLFARAEKVRQESLALRSQLIALCELRLLEREFRSVARELASTIGTPEAAATQESVYRILTEAEQWIVPSSPG
jgi:hypothetical protein